LEAVLMKNTPRILGVKEVTVGSWVYLVGSQPQKNLAPHSMGYRRS
jgi:hypothetical protein